MPRSFHFPIPTTCGSILPPILTPGADEAADPRLSSHRCPKANSARIPFLVDLNPPASAARRTISSAWKPACRRPEETLTAGLRLLPRLRRGSWCRRRASSRSRGALRPGLPHSAQGRRRSARWTDGHRQGFLRSACLDRNLCPGAGWVGFDVTSGLLCGEGHIPLASIAALSIRRADLGNVDAANINVFASICGIDRIHEGAAHHQAVLR